MKKSRIVLLLLSVPLSFYAQTMQLHRGGIILNYKTHLIDSISFTHEDLSENSNEGQLLNKISKLEQDNQSLIGLFSSWDKKKPGDWKTPPTQDLSLTPLFSIYDDDVVDKYSPTSFPGSYTKQGYFSILYPREKKNRKT